jgi:hypothetical protein
MRGEMYEEEKNGMHSVGGEKGLKRNIIMKGRISQKERRGAT